MFDFNNAEIPQGSTTPTIQPGIHQVKIESITNGLSEQKQSPFIEVTVTNSNGAKLANRYYLSTVISEGKTKSAWDINRNSILSLVAACLSLNETDAKAKMPQAKSAEELATKLSALCVGKEVRLKVTGEEKLANSGNKYIASSFSQGVFVESIKVPANESKLYFSAEKNIKMLPVVAASQGSSTNDPF